MDERRIGLVVVATLEGCLYPAVGFFGLIWWWCLPSVYLWKPHKGYFIRYIKKTHLNLQIQFPRVTNRSVSLHLTYYTMFNHYLCLSISYTWIVLRLLNYIKLRNFSDCEQVSNYKYCFKFVLFYYSQVGHLGLILLFLGILSDWTHLYLYSAFFFKYRYLRISLLCFMYLVT